MRLEPTCPPPVASPSRPRLALPPGAVDAHCHVFGPHARFPFAHDRTFTPIDVPKERLLALHAFLGLARAVVVQSACHGSDHGALLDLLAARPDYRGVALITPSTPREEIARLDAAGICGFRVNFLPHLGEPPSRADLDAMLELTAPFGWHIELHIAGAPPVELIRSLDAKRIVDHLGRIEDPADARGLEALLDAGVWIKLSGSDRVPDGVALARRLRRHAPERVVWGTDFPHPNHPDPPDDGELVDRLETIAGEDLERVLVHNPAEFFG